MDTLRPYKHHASLYDELQNLRAHGPRPCRHAFDRRRTLCNSGLRFWRDTLAHHRRG